MALTMLDKTSPHHGRQVGVAARNRGRIRARAAEITTAASAPRFFSESERVRVWIIGSRRASGSASTAMSSDYFWTRSAAAAARPARA